MSNIVGVRFQGWSDKIYHYKNDFDLVVNDIVMIVDTKNLMQVVTVTHVDCDERDDIEYKHIRGKVLVK